MSYEYDFYVAGFYATIIFRCVTHLCVHIVIQQEVLFLFGVLCKNSPLGDGGMNLCCLG